MKPSLKRALLFGLLYALVGISVSIQLSIDPHTNRDEFPNYSGPAAFLAPALIWYLLVEIRQKTGVVRGAVAGVLGSVLSHVVCWFLLFLAPIIQYWILGQSMSNKPSANLGWAVLGALDYSFFSLVAYGWLTPVWGGILGGLFGWLCQKKAAEGRNKTPEAGDYNAMKHRNEKNAQ